MEEDLRRTMAAVTDAQRRYVELVESLPEGVVAVDGDDAIALVNVRAEELFGYLRGELIGRPLELLLPAPDLTAGDDPVGRRRDGSEFPVEVGVRATGGGDGVAAIRLVTDITGRRELERQLRQTQKLEAVGRLAGGVAHDFNNVLQVVIGRPDELARRARSDDDRSDLADIGAAAERAAALTRQLLAFSRRQALAPVDLDLNEVVRELERMLGRLIGDDVLLRVELAPTPLHVRADRSQLEQVVLNLVVNARDAMPRGGTIVVSTAPFDDGAGGRWVRLEVSDTGCGMDEATAARAFEPFFTTKGDDRGTGLGLATVHGIATQSGGRVRLRTAPGRGATISIELPAVAAPSATRAWPETERRTAPGGGRVLLVEDDAVVRRLLESMLAELGYDVAAAGDGAAALALGGAFDLVVTDHMLPGMTGPELVERLGPSAPPVLYVSGYAPAAADAPGPAGGRAGFLQKPFGVDELARAARELLDARP